MGNSADIYLADLRRGVASRFTFNGGRNPLWSGDGKQIVFRKPDGIYVKPANGGGAEALIYRDTNIRNLTDLSSDGKFLLMGRSSEETGFDMWLLSDPLGHPGTRLTALLQSPANEGLGRFSPQSPMRVAYTGDESGNNQIYLIPMPGAPPGKWQISDSGGYAPRWRKDGRELFYVAPDLRTVMAVEVDSWEPFRTGQTRKLFQTATPIVGAAADQGFAVAPSGNEFAISLEGPRTSATMVNIILNWKSGD
jgi:Tol biopolymer transport system component